MIQCISLWQPWAALIALHAKRIETRSWSPGLRLRHGQQLAIHAAKKWNRESAALCLTEPFLTALQPVGGITGLQFGGFVALAEFIEAIPTTDAQPNEQERAFGDYRPGRFAWLLANVRAIPFIPARGHQSLWTVPETTFEEPA